MHGAVQSLSSNKGLPWCGWWKTMYMGVVTVTVGILFGSHLIYYQSSFFLFLLFLFLSFNTQYYPIPGV
jgi:uncharacterized membrane protein HdeD (DUF308 family)